MPPAIIHKQKQFVDALTIDQGHVIMTSHVPKSVGTKAFIENYYRWKNPTPESVARFGLFGDGMNYHTYYPDVTSEELHPKEDEFVNPVFRLLSATIVSKNWYPTDFGHIPGVLKNSMSLLLGQTVNCDHSTDIGNAIGSVSEVMWQEAYKEGSIYIPAGINGVLKIDGKSNPRIARGILMEPPSIHSNSVTVQFAWERSHPELSDSEFYDKIGSYDSKGQLIRRIVTNIVRYLETSLVSHGADPYAQKINKDGKLNNPNFAHRTWTSYSEYLESKDKIYTFEDYKDQNTNDTPPDNNKGETSSQKESPDNNNLTKQTSNMDKDVLALLEPLFGEGKLPLAEGQEMNQETAVAAIQALVSSQATHQGEIDSLNEKVTNLTTERDSLQEKVTSLESKVSSLETMSNIGKNYLTSLREETVETYRKLHGDQADESIINMLNAETTGVQTLLSLKKDYTSRLNEKFPMKCAECGSTNVSRASSAKEGEEDKKDETSNSEVTTRDAIDSIYRTKLKAQ